MDRQIYPQHGENKTNTHRHTHTRAHTYSERETHANTNRPSAFGSSSSACSSKESTLGIRLMLRARLGACTSGRELERFRRTGLASSLLFAPCVAVKGWWEKMFGQGWALEVISMDSSERKRSERAREMFSVNMPNHIAVH